MSFLDQRIALKELKADDKTKIHPFDKGTGLVKIPKDEAIRKIEEQIGNTEIKVDPTTSLARKFQSTLRKLKKQNKFTEREYEQLYPSDLIPPRMYGAIKAHKPEKNYPMRVIVSTIGTPSYKTSDHLVNCLLYTSPSPRDKRQSRMPSSA